MPGKTSWVKFLFGQYLAILRPHISSAYFEECRINSVSESVSDNFYAVSFASVHHLSIISCSPAYLEGCRIKDVSESVHGRILGEVFPRFAPASIKRVRASAVSRHRDQQDQQDQQETRIKISRSANKLFSKQRGEGLTNPQNSWWELAIGQLISSE